ncbi:MAG: 8-amino-7-oxononanoate synthase, partial [Verrucomicrobiota bacterium]
MPSSFTERLARELAELKAQDLRRQLRCVEKVSGTEIVVDGRTLLNFSSNDYLGLASHPALQDAALRAARDFGFGATASRLICGTT